MRLKIIVISLLIIIFALAKENRMDNILKNVELVEIDGKSVIEITLCNQSTEVYYVNHLPSVILFSVKQNGKRVDYKGPIIKQLRNVFPETYEKINPNECLVLSSALSNGYHFNPNEDIEISYGMSIYDKEQNIVEKVSFTKTLKVQKTDSNKKYERIKRYRLE